MVKSIKIKILTILCYLINVLKLLCTFLIPFTNGATMYFSIGSFPILLLLGVEQIALHVRLALLIVLILIWCLIIIISLLGLRNKKAMVILFILSIIAATFDLALPLIYSYSYFKIIQTLSSLIIILINLNCIIKQKEIRCFT